MTSSTLEAISQLRERCSHAARRLAPTMHTPHRGVATRFMIWPLHKRRLRLRPSRFAKLILMIAVLPLATTSKLNASPEEDAKTVAALDTKYQAAVKANDAATMDQVLADDFVLVMGAAKFLVKPIYLTPLERKKSPTNVRTKNQDHRRSEYGVIPP
jgi:hypothetical protein